MSRPIGKLKTGWWGTEVRVAAVDTLPDGHAGEYKKGSFWPFSIFNAGSILVTEKYSENRQVLSHELQHAKGSADFRVKWKGFRWSSARYKYYRERRAYVVGIAFTPVKDRKFYVDWTIDLLDRQIGKTKDEIRKDMEATAEEFGFDLYTYYEEAPIPWAKLY